jgi:glycosyltransferase involved in cell wall biosynthesis
MKNLRTQDEVMASWKGDLNQPVVSICCIAYNHEKFIEETLRGFLIQETDFPFEIVIHDDASSDRTADVIREYAEKYPKLFRAIYQTEKQYSKGNRPTMIVFPLCIGKYIAVCEGDDYWRDPSKLSKQVEYLDAHEEVVISSHDAIIVDEFGNKIQDSKLSDENKRDYSGKELMLGSAWLLTLNWMIRNIDIPEIPERRMVENGDDFLVSVLGSYGGSHHHEDIMPSAYRLHQGGVWSALSDEEKIDTRINTWFWMYRYYKRLGIHDCERVYWQRFVMLVASKISSKFLFVSLAKRCVHKPVKSCVKKILSVLGMRR